MVQKLTDEEIASLSAAARLEYFEALKKDKEEELKRELEQAEQQLEHAQEDFIEEEEEYLQKLLEQERQGQKNSSALEEIAQDVQTQTQPQKTEQSSVDYQAGGEVNDAYQNPQAVAEQRVSNVDQVQNPSDMYQETAGETLSKTRASFMGEYDPTKPKKEYR